MIQNTIADSSTNADQDSGSTGTWPGYDPYYASGTATGPYEPDYISFNYCRFIESPITYEPDIILKNKGPEVEPKPTWKLTPVKSITVRPELRIKQPVARAGYRRGKRV